MPPSKGRFLMSATLILTAGDDPADHQAALEDRDYYTQENVFWVPADARWESLRHGQSNRYWTTDRSSTGCHREREPDASGQIGQAVWCRQLEPGRLGELVDLISTIGFDEDQRSGMCLVRSTNISSGSSPGQKGRRAVSSIRLPMWSKLWLPCWHLTRVGYMTPAVDRAECLCRANSSSRLTAGSAMTFDLRAGEQPHHLALGGDEPGDSWVCCGSWSGTC